MPPTWAAAPLTTVSKKNKAKLGNVFFIRVFNVCFFGGTQAPHHLFSTGTNTQSSQPIHKNFLAFPTGALEAGLYRRQIKAITYLGKVEKLLGVSATRNGTPLKGSLKFLITLRGRLHG
jgi:hypothetical protein